MSIFSAALITRFSNEGEEVFAREFPCIIDRVALSIVSGTSIYTLSDYIVDVRKITWKGLRLDPYGHRRYRESFSPSSTGIPNSYIYNNIGQSQIKFLPAPNVTIASVSSNLFGSEIINRVIVEYYRTPDFNTNIIPSFFRRRLLKAYVLKNCFSVEGPGQNLKAAKYWESKWNYLKETYGNLLDELINSPRRIIIGGTSSYRRLIPTPQIPYNSQGIGVNPGE